MATTTRTNKSAERANASNVKWIVLFLIVMSVIGYSLYTDVPIKNLTLSQQGMGIEFGVKSLDQTSASSHYEQPNEETINSEMQGSYVINVPGEDPMPLASISSIMVEPGPDDFQNRHLALIRKALDAGRLNVKYEEPDPYGTFATWLTSIRERDEKKIISYQTRLVRDNGEIELAMREAYKEGDVWMTQIQPMIKEIMTGESEIDNPVDLETPRIKSPNAVIKALESQRLLLVTGQLSPEALINLCFVDGRVRQEWHQQLLLRNETIAENIGLTYEAAMIIAQYGYQMYLDEEYLGSKIFWETMIMLVPHSDYYNLLGACKEKLGDQDEAYKAYEEAIRLDPNNESAKTNLARLAAKL